VCLAALLGVRKAIGVELVSHLASDARRNAERLAGSCPIEIVTGDAALFDPVDGTVFFLFDPFGAATCALVAENIRRSLLRRPRHIRIVYVKPLYSHVFDKQDWLIPMARSRRDVRVWESASRFSESCV